MSIFSRKRSGSQPEEDLNPSLVVRRYLTFTEEISTAIANKQFASIGAKLARVASAEDPISSIFSSAGQMSSIDSNRLRDLLQNTSLDDFNKAYDEEVWVKFSSDKAKLAASQWPEFIEVIKNSLADGNGILNGVTVLLSQAKSKKTESPFMSDPLMSAQSINVFKAIFILIAKTGKADDLLIDQLNMGSRDELMSAFVEETDGTITLNQFTCGYLLGIPILTEVDVKRIRPAIIAAIADLIAVLY